MKQALGYLAQLVPVRLAWTSKMYGGKFKGRQPESLTVPEWEEMATFLRRRIYWATRDERDPAQRLEVGLKAYFEFYDEYRAWNRRLALEGLGIDESFEARQAQLYETLAGGFAPTLTELGVRSPEMAAAALIGMAAQAAYWQHYQRQQPPAMNPSTLARACACLFLHGAPSIPSPSTSEGGPHA